MFSTMGIISLQHINTLIIPYLSISSMKNHLPRYLPTYRAVPRSRHVAPCWLARMKFWLTCSLRHEYIIMYFYYYFPLYFLFVSFNLGSQLPTNQESWLSITHILRHLCIFLFINIKYYFPFIVMLFLNQYGIKKYSIIPLYFSIISFYTHFLFSFHLYLKSVEYALSIFVFYYENGLTSDQAFDERL